MPTPQQLRQEVAQLRGAPLQFGPKLDLLHARLNVLEALLNAQVDQLQDQCALLRHKLSSLTREMLRLEDEVASRA